jgi:hypothetical protein
MPNFPKSPNAADRSVCPTQEAARSKTRPPPRKAAPISAQAEAEGTRT